jgi:hypothetical protein
LKSNIEKFFTYFENNKDKLLDNNKDNLSDDELNKISYVKSFNDSKKISDEYFSAISNYDFYEVSSKEQNKSLFVDNNENVNVLSVDLAIKYLKEFNYINLSNVKISLRNSDYCNSLTPEYDKDEYENPYCYKIENLTLNNRTRLDFLLTPSDYNEISRIVIN